jgi:protein O-GlcNAc transferase
MNEEDQAERHYRAGLAAHDCGDYETAETEYRRALQLNRKHLMALFELGTVLYGFRGTVEQAKAVFEEVVELDDSFPYGEMYLGQSLHRLGDIEGAEQHFLRAIDLAALRGDATEAAVILTTFGGFLASIERFAVAEETFRRSLEIKPDFGLTLCYYARLLGRLGRDREAEEMFRKLIRLEPDDPHACREYGKFLARRGRFDEAEEQVRRSIALDPRSETSQHLLLKLMRSKQAD